MGTCKRHYNTFTNRNRKQTFLISASCRLKEANRWKSSTSILHIDSAPSCLKRRNFIFGFWLYLLVEGWNICVIRYAASEKTDGKGRCNFILRRTPPFLPKQIINFSYSRFSAFVMSLFGYPRIEVLGIIFNKSSKLSTHVVRLYFFWDFYVWEGKRNKNLCSSMKTTAYPPCKFLFARGERCKA